MYNIPADASINGNILYHEGNHYDQPGMHPHFLSSYDNWHHAATTGDSYFGYQTKIGTIDYIPNNNVALKYSFDIFSVVDDKEFRLDIICKSTFATCSATMQSNGDVQAIIKTSTYQDINGTTHNKIDIYLQINRSWYNIFYRLRFAKNILYYSWNDKYAYHGVTFYDSQPYVNGLSTDITVSYVYPPLYLTATNTETSLAATTDADISLTVPGVDFNHIYTACPQGNIPGLLSYNIVCPYTGLLYIKAYNHASYAITFPALTWNIMLQRYQ